MATPRTATSDFDSVERIKAGSRGLRGTLAEGLRDEVTGAILPGDNALLKFHGAYQQDDRDVRNERQHRKLEPAYQFMVRLRMPGGACSPAQWLALDDLAQRYANASLRATTRQTFQLHGVLKRNLKHTIQGINEALFTTLATCVDINRNVICHPSPELSRVHASVHGLAERLSTECKCRPKPAVICRGRYAVDFGDGRWEERRPAWKGWRQGRAWLTRRPKRGKRARPKSRA